MLKDIHNSHGTVSNIFSPTCCLTYKTVLARIQFRLNSKLDPSVAKLSKPLTILLQRFVLPNSEIPRLSSVSVAVYRLALLVNVYKHSNTLQHSTLMLHHHPPPPELRFSNPSQFFCWSSLIIWTEGVIECSHIKLHYIYDWSKKNLLVLFSGHGGP